MKKQKYKKSAILVTLLIAIAVSIYYLNSQKVAPIETESKLQKINMPNGTANDEEAIRKKSGIFQFAPELTGIFGYINTDSNLTIASLRGKVVLVDFWTYTCINCIRTFPYLKSWHEKYKDDGLVIIGVHTPEFEFEKKYENVKDAVEKYNLQYAVVQDNNYATWHVYKNRFWPHKYIVDIDGFIRYDHIGEGAYEKTEKVIQELLNERNHRLGQEKVAEGMAKPDDTADVEYGKIGTPEIYLGYNFARGNFGNEEGLMPNQIIDYKIPLIADPNKVYLEGKWKINKDNAELVSSEGRIMLGYNAKAVNIVANSKTGSEVDVLLDTMALNESKIGHDVKIKNNKSIAEIKEERLYNLVDYEYGSFLLELRIKGGGFKIYTFTFG